MDMESFCDAVEMYLFQKKMTPLDLSKKTKIPQPTISLILNKKSKSLKNSTINKFATFFNVSADNLIRNPKIILQNIATVVDQPKGITSIPVYNLSDLKYNSNSSDKIPTISNEYIASTTSNNSCFAVKLDNDEMFPSFEDGSILIIDTHFSLKDKKSSYALYANNSDLSVKFRKLVIEGKLMILQPINTKYESVIFNERAHKLIGILVESRQSF